MTTNNPTPANTFSPHDLWLGEQASTLAWLLEENPINPKSAALGIEGVIGYIILSRRLTQLISEAGDLSRLAQLAEHAMDHHHQPHGPRELFEEACQYIIKLVDKYKDIIPEVPWTDKLQDMTDSACADFFSSTTPNS